MLAFPKNFLNIVQITADMSPLSHLKNEHKNNNVSNFSFHSFTEQVVF
jgi:hypothetical protein